MKLCLPALLLSMMVALFFSRPGEARACGSGGSNGLVTAIVLGTLATGALDIGLSGADLVMAVAGKKPGRGYGIAELAIAAPQALLLGTAALSTQNPDDQGILWLLTAWTGAMAAHGAWVAFHDRPPGEKRATPAEHERRRQRGASAEPRFSLAPSVLRSCEGEVTPGALLFGQF